MSTDTIIKEKMIFKDTIFNKACEFASISLVFWGFYYSLQNNIFIIANKPKMFIAMCMFYVTTDCFLIVIPSFFIDCAYLIRIKWIYGVISNLFCTVKNLSNNLSYW